MYAFIARSLLRGVAVLLVVSFVTFTLVFGNGPGIARSVLSTQVGSQPTDADVRVEMAKLGLDQPLLTQYGKWLGHAVTGDFGDSFFTNQPVTSILSVRAPVTLNLIILSLVVTLVASVLIGVLAAVRGGWIDRVIQFLAVLGAAVPPFVVGIALVFLFAVSMRLFPATGYVPFAQSPTDWARSMTLPVLAILLGTVANAASQFRGAVLDTLSKDFVRTLRARGIPESKIFFRHVLRNSAGPGLTVLSLQTISLIGGAVFIEQVFSLPGLGAAGNTSAQQGDVPVVMGCVVVTIAIVLAVNLLADLANAALNPKARA
ncbi:ABC transporter permease [Streptomyces sp. NPDC048282]|uniref:ABC transporter permease n=1 Tax=Streptomyces sp. NPDC048282 TaxID=3365528 RepID=UPI00370FDB5A